MTIDIKPIQARTVELRTKLAELTAQHAALRKEMELVGKRLHDAEHALSCAELARDYLTRVTP